MIQAATEAPAQRAMGLLRAAGDPNRLRLLRLIDRAELSVGELAEVTDLSQPSVSRHLSALREAGLIEERHEGRRTLSRPADGLPEPAASLSTLLRATYAAPGFGFESDLEGLRALLDRRKADRSSRFDRLAGDWDALRGGLFGGALGPGEVAGMLLPAGSRWVDVGTGTGMLLPWLSALAGPEGEVLAIESSGRMLEAARQRALGLRLSNVRLVPGDMARLPAADAWADGLVFSLSLGHAERVDEALSEAARVLRPGGRLAVADLRPHAHADLTEALGEGFRGFDPEVLAERLRGAGFEQIRLLERDEAGPPPAEDAPRDRDLPRLKPLRLIAQRCADGRRSSRSH